CTRGPRGATVAASDYW
nr:immunoglobulin heavy chain junction region [Macaca mulatta]MOY23725.1 immunoglobulin heavy chain junction region [Macaca mulatta]MOY27857.1 immunoglobulin heavy chain junction region [Macaca mulatta]MOY28894.1 immunoglobulin heavy chain junction region [Macaca mulatta]MOY30348.1 immunoglobulin heavy chain junction region [Macaca mulatta]